LPQRSELLLEPRKSPVQARSAASVDAILEATIQVLLNVGKERLTTTRVTMRAGVSVGTLYQYFPNKSALLQGALKRHLAVVTEAVELVCKEQQGRTLREMVTALITAFLDAKMRDARTSVALCSVSSDSISVRVGSRKTQKQTQSSSFGKNALAPNPSLRRDRHHNFIKSSILL
jgi:AcrR family transcriptional regulator